MPGKPTRSTTQANGSPVFKSGWRRVRFEQMAENIGDRVDDPSQAGVERYVGLEHLDPETLRIRRWGTPDEVEATKLRFQPGDIIFGKRRAYQRKLAVADFEGICSAHAMVLRAREDTVVKEFLPVFMQSDIFFERALSISVGSLSPTINWKTLAAQEFVIPPKDEQHRFAEILWTADEVIESYHGVQDALSKLKEARTISFLGGKLHHWPSSAAAQHQLPTGWRWSTIGETCEVGNGTTPSKSVPKNWEDGDIPWVSSGKVNDHTISTASALITKKGFDEAHLRLLPRGTILIAMIGEGKTRGMAAILDIDGCGESESCLCDLRRPNRQQVSSGVSRSTLRGASRRR